MMRNRIKKIIYYFFSYSLDLPSRIIEVFNPIFHSYNLRVTKIFDNKSETSKIIFIFVVFQKNKIPFYVKNVLECLEKLKVTVHIIANEDIGVDAVDYLNTKCHRLILRKNIGRDFGAYKDGIASVDIMHYEKLFLINDSIFYFNKNLSKLFERVIADDADVISLFENFEIRYHAQSFFIGFSKNVISKDFFIGYWRAYMPFSSRLHSINAGEVGLSKSLIANGFCPIALNNMYELRRKLLVTPATQIMQLLDIIWAEYPSTIKNSLKVIRSEIQSSYNLAELRLELNSALEPNIFFSQKIISDIIRALEKANPTHFGPMLFAKLLGANYFKRDLYFRKTVSLSEFQGNLVELGIANEEIQAAIVELKLKGTIDELGVFRRIKAYHGLL
ncbi:hypothetical protein G7Z35_01740 [Polynucleobacter paneuropaeus]|uniref:rhamnan synthesis F family protein n=1 Tax=Polynucleobacter paneuropaeus TaxID=2527775 RepID=UPI001BFDA37A|nr:rhamnan synthesis F family protein [Polynucleobacter paneuropaeus]QWD49719.1 hypothetical protein G7Z35_01740 [Polynucleobacter paneuropaeus]